MGGSRRTQREPTWTKAEYAASAPGDSNLEPWIHTENFKNSKYSTAICKSLCGKVGGEGATFRYTTEDRTAFQLSLSPLWMKDKISTKARDEMKLLFYTSVRSALLPSVASPSLHCWVSVWSFCRKRGSVWRGDITDLLVGQSQENTKSEALGARNGGLWSWWHRALLSADVGGEEQYENSQNLKPQGRSQKGDCYLFLASEYSVWRIWHES